jgi:hypothetical protein
LVEWAVALPLEYNVKQVVSDSAQREAALALEAFGKKFPDWQKHEEAMTELSHKLPPGPGMSEAEYLETLYYLVTRDGATGDAVKKVVERMKESAKGGKPGTTVASKAVSDRPAGPPTFRQAYEAAKAGRRLE